MRVGLADLSERGDAHLPYRVRDVAMDVGLLMVATIFTLLGGTGLLGHLAGIDYPLNGLMVADAALTGFLAGLGLLGWLYGKRWLSCLAALPLVLITLYTLIHNGLAGGPWAGESWVSGGPRTLSAAALLLFLAALCTALGMSRPWHRLVWAGSGLLALSAGSFSLLLLILPDSRIGWSEGFVSAPVLATLYALLGGLAFTGAAWRGSRPMLPLGPLPRLAAVAGVMVSCLAWYTLSWSAQSDIQRQATTLLDNAALNAGRTMQSQLELIERLSWRQGLLDPPLAHMLWEHDISAFFQHEPHLEALGIINPAGELEALHAQTEHDHQALLHALTTPTIRDWLSLTWQEPKALMAPSAPMTILLSAPLSGGAGNLIAKLNLARLLERELGVQLGMFRLTIGGDMPYLVLRQPGRATTESAERPLPHLGQRHVGLPGGTRLTLDAHMDSVSSMLRAGIMPGGFAIAGLTLSYLLALSLGLVRLVMGRSQELMAARQRLEAQYDLEQRYRSLYLYHPDGVFSLDRNGCVVTANDACTEITGRPNEEMLGNHFSCLLKPEDVERIQVIYDATLSGQTKRAELQIQHRDGRLRSLNLTTMPIIVEGVTQGVFGIAKDITQQREQEAQLAYQATHDLLTGLSNHSAFDKCLEETCQRLQQNGGLLVVMHLDLDGFKAVNDGLGYHIGNQLLMAVAKRLRHLVGEDDGLARLTGDEFALLFTSLDGCQAGVDMAERVLNTLSMPYKIEGYPVHISVSIGIACNCDSVERPHELMQRADLAMADAKQQGRNTWHWYQGDVQRITEESVLLRHDLYAALSRDQFELYYQPIVEAKNGHIRGLEALIRWHHPEKGMISPGVFIPLAEQTGQIIPLGRWILHRACRDAAAMCATGERVVPVAVNISSLQFRRTGFLADVEQALTESGLPPELLELEVTESILLDGVDHAVELINQLKSKGIKVALDDFGTGFSSLSYLRDLPIHKVKLDRSFIHDIADNRNSAPIVQGIITMAHHLELVVVAEGIEEREQQQDLKRRQCDLLQGFYFAKPMPQNAIVALPGQLPAPVGL